MNIWETLGIAATQDRKQIKLAYSVRLKAMDHENEVLRFQELRQAYEQALAYSGRNTPAQLPVLQDFDEADSLLDRPEEVTGADHPAAGNLTENAEAAQPKQHSTPSRIQPEKPLPRSLASPARLTGAVERIASPAEGGLSPEAFLQRCNDLYHSGYKTRYTGPEWYEMLTDEKNAPLKYNKKLSRSMFHFVAEHTDFSPEVLLALNSFFQWTDHESFWATQTSNDNFEIFLLKIRKGLFSFESFNFGVKVDFSKYFALREALYGKHLAYMRIRNKGNLRALRHTLHALNRVCVRDAGLKNVRKFVQCASAAKFFAINRKLKIRKNRLPLLALVIIATLLSRYTAITMVATLTFLAIIWALWTLIKKPLKTALDKYSQLCTLY